jgi:hypothetical protein
MIEERPCWNFLILRIWRSQIRAISPQFAVIVGYKRLILPAVLWASRTTLFGDEIKPLYIFQVSRVVLDSRLTWREHVDVKVRKAYNLLWACRKAYGVTWGLRPRLACWLYVSIIRPSITFAFLEWWPGCQTASAKKPLSRIERLAC